MTDLLGHFVVHIRRVGVGAAQCIGKRPVDAVVLVLVGNSERENLLLGQIGKALHCIARKSLWRRRGADLGILETF